MSEHIHVERRLPESGATGRNLVVSMLGRATDAPSVVTTGCGIEVPYAMTAREPEAVTCLACREHAAREYHRLADQFDRFSQPGRLPGMNISAGQLAEGARRLRDLATRFSA